MKHDTFTEKISLWLDDELTPAEIKELQQHLTGCPACQQVHQAMAQVHNLLHQASTYIVEPAPGFTTRFESRLAHSPQKSWQMWLGLSVLLLSTLGFFAVGAILAWLSLVGVSSNLIDLSAIYYGLAFLGATVNDIRALANFAGIGLKVALLTMIQPLFWVYVFMAIGLAALWVRLMQGLYRRAQIPAQLFVF
jgi:predicted anti-sigma-YlaC factor YlaD